MLYYQRSLAGAMDIVRPAVLRYRLESCTTGVRSILLIGRSFSDSGRARKRGKGIAKIRESFFRLFGARRCERTGQEEGGRCSRKHLCVDSHSCALTWRRCMADEEARIRIELFGGPRV